MSKNSLVLSAIRDGQAGSRTTRGVCPFCVRGGHATRKRNLELDRATGRWFCYRCHKAGHLDGWEPDEGAIRAARVLGEGVPFFPIPEGWYELGHGKSTIVSRAYCYARSRWLSQSAIVQARMGIITHKPVEEDEQDFRNRLIVPILDRDNENWLGYVGRDLTGRSSLTYMYKRGMLRGRILYNQKVIYEKTDEPVLVVEGTLDTAYLWPNSVAVLGTWSEDQFQILLESQRPVVVVLDGDAWRKGEALAMKLKLHGLRAGHVRLPPTKDPDEVPKQWLAHEVQKSLS